MRCSCSRHEPLKVRLDLVELEVANEFKYLVFTICSNGWRDVEVSNRLKETARMIGGGGEVWDNCGEIVTCLLAPRWEWLRMWFPQQFLPILRHEY